MNSSSLEGKTKILFHLIPPVARNVQSCRFCIRYEYFIRKCIYLFHISYIVAFWLNASRKRGHSWRRGRNCGCKRYCLWVQFPLEDMKYLRYIFPVSSHWCRGKAQTQRKVENGVSQKLDSLCLSYCVRSTA